MPQGQKQLLVNLADQPTVRIGVVLPVDHRNRMTLALPASVAFAVSTASEPEILRPRSGLKGCVELISARNGDRLLRLELQSDPRTCLTGVSITITPLSLQELTAGGGIRLGRVNVGRSFHFGKVISQSLLGTLHFYRHDDHIVVVNELPVEWYVAGVIAAEMSGDCPVEFLKAQAVAARTWAHFNDPGKHGRLFRHCNDDCCQRYQGTNTLTEDAIRAVTETHRQVLTDSGGGLLNTYYSKCCGGIMTQNMVYRKNSGSRLRHFATRVSAVASRWVKPERSSSFDKICPPGNSPAFPKSEQAARRWIESTVPDTNGIFCDPSSFQHGDLSRYLGHIDESRSYFRWDVKFEQGELVEALQNGGGIDNIQTVTEIAPVRREASGRIGRLRVRYIDLEGRSRTLFINGEYSIRKSLSGTFLYSSAFVVDKIIGSNGDISGFEFHGAGWGHGTGMCQLGAVGMSLKGYSYKDILIHYFKYGILQEQGSSVLQTSEPRA